MEQLHVLSNNGSLGTRNKSDLFLPLKGLKSGQKNRLVDNWNSEAFLYENSVLLF